MSLHFDNAFVRELPADPIRENHRRQVAGALYSRVAPTPVAAPRLVAHSPEVAAMLGLDPADPQFAAVFGGNALLDGMEPWAAAYGGHQFGNWAGQLGDGRAISLGEVVTPAHGRLELQLKGAGPTPYSRGADGRAVLRSSVREFLCSEAMHHLGVPTTRALSLVATGEAVMRDMFYDGNPAPEPGAVVCRVSPSFIRFGNFELPAARHDEALLKTLVDFTMKRDYPGLGSPAAFFGEVCARTARMIAHWMRVGFVHGVMNTDNMSIVGLTIDYGPYGWVDDFDPDWTPNTTDAGQRRYRFGQQPAIAHWNLVRLANALVPVFGAENLAPLHEGLDRYETEFARAWRETITAKLGLPELATDDDVALMRDLEALLHAGEVDMTIWFRALANVEAPTLDALDDAFYDPAKRAAVAPALEAWLARWLGRALPLAARKPGMDAANPKYVLRNYLAQEAIDRAHDGDDAGVLELLDVMRRPYDEQPGRERFAARRPDWARSKPGCSALSCSS